MSLVNVRKLSHKIEASLVPEYEEVISSSRLGTEARMRTYVLDPRVYILSHSHVTPAAEA